MNVLAFCVAWKERERERESLFDRVLKEWGCNDIGGWGYRTNFNINNVGGAIEITLTRESNASDDTKKSQLAHIMGYIALFGNTICMVGGILIVCGR